MLILTEIFGTRYFSSNWASDVKYVLECINMSVTDTHKYKKVIESVKDLSVVEIDIADARFTPTVGLYVMEYASNPRFYIIDSANPVRHAMLQKTRDNALLEYEVVALPNLHDIKQLGNYLMALDRDTVYTRNSDTLKSVYLSLIITMYRPAIKIDLADIMINLFEYVMNNMDMSREVFKSYSYVCGESTFTTEFIDGQAYVPSYGNLNWEEFKNSVIFIPAALGRDRLVDSSEELWAKLLKTVVSDLSDLIAKSTTIHTYFK